MLKHLHHRPLATHNGTYGALSVVHNAGCGRLLVLMLLWVWSSHSWRLATGIGECLGTVPSVILSGPSGSGPEPEPEHPDRVAQSRESAARLALGSSNRRGSVSAETVPVPVVWHGFGAGVFPDGDLSGLRA